MSVRAQFWVSGHRRDWGKPGVMSRQEDLRLIIPPPPNVDQSVLLRSCPIPKGREAGRGRQVMPNIYQCRPGLTGWGIFWASVQLILSQPQDPLVCAGDELATWSSPPSELLFLLWSEGLSSVISASHMFTVAAHGMDTSLDQMCLVEIPSVEASKHSSHRARARTGYSFLRRSNEMYVNNSPPPTLSGTGLNYAMGALPVLPVSRNPPLQSSKTNSKKPINNHLIPTCP